MRRSKELMLLLALLVGAMIFVLWYVIDRRAKNRAMQPAPVSLAPTPASATPSATSGLGPTPAAVPATPPPSPANPPVTLGTAETERKTIDFSSGQPVVKNTPEDQAAIDAAMKDIAEASKEVTFDPPAAKPATKP
jgi:hypothetical protein